MCAMSESLAAETMHGTQTAAVIATESVLLPLSTPQQQLRFASTSATLLHISESEQADRAGQSLGDT